MIEATKLGKDFRDSSGIGFVLKEVSLCLNRGRITGVVGTNGSGKSTLLKLLAGLLEPDTGSMVLKSDGAGEEVAYPGDLVGKVLYLDQDASRDLVPSMTVGENLGLAQTSSWTGGLGFAGRGSLRAEVSKALAQVSMGLEDDLRQQVRFLSGGERQGVVLARALMLKPQVLLLDEFVSAITRDLGVRFMSIVRQMVVERHCYCALVSHDIDLVIRFADEVVFLHDGAVRDTFAGGDGATRARVLDLMSQCLQEAVTA